MSDLITAEQDISIPEITTQRVLEPAIEDFLEGGEGSYAQTFEGARELMAGDDEDEIYDTAYFIPAIRFFLKTSLDLLAQEEVAPQLPLEVEDRQSAAKTVINHIATDEGIGEVLEDAYEKTGIEAPVEELNFDNENSVAAAADLTKAVFSDISLLAGGSLKLLRDKELASDDEGRVIQQSYGLLRLSRVSDIVLPQIHTNFGRPYINIKHLRVSGEGDDLRVRFTLELLKNFVEKGYINKETGCPVGRIKSGDAKGTILMQDWRSVSGFLVPEGATIDNYKEVE